MSVTTEQVILNKITRYPQKLFWNITPKVSLRNITHKLTAIKKNVSNADTYLIAIFCNLH